ncbi:MAG TPA: aminotransferase class I/II-fold pyridoxal phosphate-dependent enzyme, partial [Longimicrobiales bacterium]
MKFRNAYREIELYEPGRTPIEVDLSDNTNLFGVAPSARVLLDALPDATITRYPTVFARPLKEALARRHQVDVENITTGCGSDDLIDSAVRAFCEPGDNVVYPAPTFGVLSTFARMNATEPVAVPMQPDFSFKEAELVAADGALTYVCSPNNPTGSVVRGSQIAELDRSLPGVLLLDEAYADYGDDDHARFAASSKRTVSLRTLSKVYGLAGLRVGYAIGPREVILEIEKSRGPYKVNGVAEAVAARVVSADGAWVARVVAQTREN